MYMPRPTGQSPAGSAKRNQATSFTVIPRLPPAASTVKSVSVLFVSGEAGGRAGLEGFRECQSSRGVVSMPLVMTCRSPR